MFPRKLLSLLFLTILVAIVIAQNQCQTNRLNDAKSGRARGRGTNLGSWFVLESWMAGGPFNDNGCGGRAGQYLLEQCLGGRARDVMERHWSSWITEGDFAEMSSHGINVVRIPVGWWHIYDDVGGVNQDWIHVRPKEYVTGGLKYLDRAFEWGQRYGIAILVGMHAAPGSQNGNDHSSPSDPGQIYWDKYPENVDQTIESIGRYAERYGNHPALYGFCLLNEPAQMNIGVLQDYYRRAYDRVRQHSGDSYIVLNPQINPFESGTEPYWTNFMNPDQGYTKVVMDLHYYSCFGGGADQGNPDGAIGYINYDRLNQIHDYANRNPKLMFIGEWSSCGHFPDQSRFGDFTRAQVNVYNEASLGWTFWSWTNGAPGNVWSLKTAFNSGWLGNVGPTC